MRTHLAIILGVIFVIFASTLQADQKTLSATDKLRDYIRFDSSTREGSEQALGFLWRSPVSHERGQGRGPAAAG